MIDKIDIESADRNAVSKFVDVGAIPKEGTRYPKYFSDSELKVLAEAIDGAVLKGLDIEVELRPLTKDRIRVNGHIRAEVVQHCVVTLEPVKTKLEEHINTEFWPEKQFLRWVNASEKEYIGTVDNVKEVEPEPYYNMEIDLGQFIYETIAASIDPYPRQSDVEFDWGTSEYNTRGVLKPEESSAFSKLKTLKDSLNRDESD